MPEIDEFDLVHVLLVDDDATTLVLYGNLLEKAGYQVTTASSGEEGVAKARAGLPDVVLLDLQMPGMDGVAVYRELRALDLPSRVVFFTGYAAASIEKQARKDDDVLVLKHPVETGDAGEVVAGWTAGHGILCASGDEELLGRIAETCRREGFTVREFDRPGDAIAGFDERPGHLACLRGELVEGRLVVLAELTPGLLVTLVQYGKEHGFEEPDHHRKSGDMESVLEAVARAIQREVPGRAPL